MYELFRGLNAEYPELSAAVQVLKDPRRGRYLEARQDIPPGVLVCVDTGKTVTFRQGRCRFCVQKLGSTSPICPRCEKSSVCRLASLVEGDLSAELRNLGLVEFAVRVLLSYPVDQILQYTEKASPLPSSSDGFSTSHFASVAALQTTTEQTVDRKALEPVLRRLCAQLKKHPSWSPVPEMEKKFEQALHFVLQRLPCNAHSIFEIDQISQSADLYPSGNKKAWLLHEQIESSLCSSSSPAVRSDPDREPLGVGLFPVASILNHSCRPNTFSYFEGNRMIFRSRGIRKGEEVTDCYGPTVFTHTIEERKAYTSNRGFDCQCSSCVNGESIDSLLTGTREEVKEGKTSSSTPYLSDDDQFGMSAKDLWAKFQSMELIYSEGNAELDRMAHFACVELTRIGDFPSALSCLDTLSRSLSARGLLFCPELGYIAHARMLILRRIWESSGSSSDLLSLHQSFFSALSVYRTFFGSSGCLTKSLMRSAVDFIDL